MSVDKSQWPQWLKDADTVGAQIEIVSGRVVWHGGDWLGGNWRDGVWHGGNWHGGNWYGGVWHGGNWRGGNWYGGVWHGGNWRGGDWLGGSWRGGNWRGGDWLGGSWHGGNWRGGNWRGGDWLGGNWHGGNWHGGNWYGGDWLGGNWHDKTIDRVPFMVSMSGVHLNADGKYVGYRSTNLDCTGRYTNSFTQVEGEYYENGVPDSGGTCQPGIHVASMATALTYFGVKPSQLWRVTFEPKDLLDADGEKCRIRGGFFEKIDWPFYRPNVP